MQKNSLNITTIKDLQGYMSLEQINDMLAMARNERDRLFLMILATSGRRISEIVGRKRPLKITYTYNGIEKEKEYPAFKGITPEDIDTHKRMIRFRIIKKRQETYKLKTISDDVFDDLIDYITKHKVPADKEIFNFSRQRGFQIVRDCARRAGINRIGMKKAHPHHFRHSFAVNLLEHSEDPAAIKKIQQMLDHCSLNVTSVYLQFNQEDLRDLQNKVFDGKEKKKGDETHEFEDIL